MTIQKNVLILVGVLILSYVIIFLFTPKDVIDYTVADTEYWRKTENRLLLKTTYDYNDKDDIASFPKNIGEWRGTDYKYPDYTYAKLNADILMSRRYTKNNKNIIWMDIINSKTGESFHKQKICVTGQGWNITNESIAEFNIANSSDPFIKLYANKLDISKGNKSQIMLYWFMFKKFGYDNSVSMIRLSAPVRTNNITTFNLMKDFVENQLFDTMYKNIEKEEVSMAEYIISKYGNNGLFAIITMLLIPFGIIIIGIRKKD